MDGQPKPLPPEIQKAQMDNQAKMQQIQMQAQLEQMKMQNQMQLEKAKQEYQAQENQLKFQLEEQRNQMDREMEMKVAQMKMMTERNTQVLLAHINNGAKIETARISAGTDDGEQAYMSEESLAHSMEHPLQPIANAISEGNQQVMQTLGSLIGTLQQQHEAANRPKQVLRDENGKITGVH